MLIRKLFLKGMIGLLGIMLYLLPLLGHANIGLPIALNQFKASFINKQTPSSQDQLFVQDPPFYQKTWPANGKLIAIKPRVDGHVQLFVASPHQWQKHPKNAKRYIQKHHLRKTLFFYSLPSSKKLTAINSFNYKEKLKEIMADCPNLINQLGQKHFRFRNIESIFAYYNRLCER